MRGFGWAGGSADSIQIGNGPIRDKMGHGEASGWPMAAAVWVLASRRSGRASWPSTIATAVPLEQPNGHGRPPFYIRRPDSHPFPTGCPHIPIMLLPILILVGLLCHQSCQRPPPYTPAPQSSHLFNITQPSSYLQSKLPSYQIKARFDFQSVNLALNQEWIELDLFRYGLAKFSAKEFEQAGLNAEDRYLIQFMADQEVSHATVLSNMLGPRAAKPCQYKYPFKTVKEFLDFCQKLTRWGESGVYGFLSFLQNPNSAQILLQSIVTEARQQMIFRQFEGLFPMPIYHVAGIPQSWAWTLLHPYLVSCPRTNPYIEFDIFPRLEILNNPDPFQIDPRPPAITHNRTSLSLPGRQVRFRFEKPGKVVGPNGDYKTLTHSKSARPKFAAWTSQYNVTYSKLEQVDEDSATTVQPYGVLFPGQVDYPVINGTVFVLLTDTDLHVTPSNITALNKHIVAGPAMYQVD